MGNISGSANLVFGGTPSSATLSVTVSGDGADASKVSWNATAGNTAVEIGTATTNGNTSSVVVTAKDPGAASANVTITASYQGQTGLVKTCSFTVSKQNTTPTITLAPAATSVAVNKTLPLTVTTTNAPAGATVVMEVASGMGTVTGSGSSYTFTPSKEGTVTITAKLMAAGALAGATPLDSDSKTITVIAAEKGVTLTTNYSQISIGGVATLTVKPTGYVAGTDYDYVSWTVSQNGAVVSMSGTTNSLTNTANGLAAGTASITASLMKNGVGTPVATTNPVSITVKNNAVTISTVQNGSAIGRYDLAGYGSYVTLYANVANANTSGYTYSWSMTNNNVISLDSTSNHYVHIQALNVGQTTLTVVVSQGITTVGTASIPVTVGQSGLQPSVTVSGYTDYLFSERDSLNKSSVVSQIESLVSNYSGRRLYSVVFSNVDSTYGNLSATRNGTYYADGVTTSTGGRLSDIVFSPRQVGKATFSFSAYYSLNGIVQNNSPLNGVLTIEVKDGVSSSGDITYTADLGKDVAFDLRDFEDYYYNKTRGTLSYVTFTLPSGGALYYDGGRLPSSNSCYASPSRTQIDLAGIYFTPTGTTATRPSSVRINFTAYGSRNYSGGTSGTVVINYLSGSAKDITYTPSGKSVSLRASDFTEAYRQAVGSTAPSGLTIQFQDVPSYGTLTYKDSSRSNSSTVTLRSSNIKNYKFTTRSSGSNQLADVTYTPSGSRNESITYIAYNGNTPQFTGKVVFNPTVVDNNMSVTFSGGQTITLDYQRFVQANASVMASTTRIRFMSLPVYGTLTYNGATVSAAGTDIVPSLLGNVVYRSSSATTVTDKVVFTCYNAAGDVVGGGQVNLNSTGTGGNNGGVTNISQFKDVNPNAWYASDLSILLSRGIMQGKLEGKFDPLGQLKYGEALKIFLLSAGYSAQEGTGKDWAAGYKTLAVNNGWISSDVDLDAKITRNAMAELAAKVLGLSATSSVPPAWKDGTSNGYANALYYTSPQILVGNADGTFKGNDTLQRQEICKIAARVLTYKSNQQSSQLPGWLS